MPRRDYPSLLVRAKKMAGALGRVPSEGELIQRFSEKGTEINLETARAMIKDVRAFRKGKEAPTPRRSRRSSPAQESSSTPEQVQQAQESKPVERKPEVERQPVNQPVVHERRYGH